MIYMFLSNNPSSGDINSSNLSCSFTPFKDVLDLGMVFTGSLGPRASTKHESHASFTESQKVSQWRFFCNVKH